MRKLISAAITLLVFTGFSVGSVAGDAAAGKEKAVVCSACHGMDGNSTNPMWPKLAGQHEAYLIKSLKDFQSGARTDPVMSPMATPLSEMDIENLAAYFSSQEQK